MQVNLTDKVAVITGGAGVLCSAFAKALAVCGAKIAILDLNQAAAEKVAVAINNNGGTALGLEANVLQMNNLIAAQQEIHKQFGSCDILINGAGGNHPKGTTTKEYFSLDDVKKSKIITFFDLERSGVEFVFNLNFLGTLLPTQVFANDMLEKKDATIINISSMNAFAPLTKIPVYSAAKAAVSNFTKWLAVHFSKLGIRVNAIAPGFFLTEQNRSLLLKEDGTFTERAQKIIDHTPLERFGKPEDLIGTLLWLVDYESSKFITGVIVPVDGGFSAYSGI